MKRTWYLALVAAGALLIACSGGGSETKPASNPAQPAAATATPVQPTPEPLVFNGGPSSKVQVIGLINKPSTLTLTEVRALPKATVTTNAMAGNSMMGEYTYGGPLLYDLLKAAEPREDARVPNDLLRRAVVITATDGYKTAIAWGEIDPRFSGKKVLVAYERNGAPLPEADGFVRLIVPGDVAAGRYISNIARIELKDSLAAPPSATKKATTSFSMPSGVTKTGDVNLARLQGLKQTTVEVASTGTKTAYGGVLLNDLLLDAGIKIDPAKKNDVLNKGIVVIGADGSAALIAGGEIDAKFGNVQVLVATTKDGAPLAEADGFARLVVPTDQAPARFVGNLARIEVVDL